MPSVPLPWLGLRCANTACNKVMPVRQALPQELDAAGEVNLPLRSLTHVCPDCGFLGVYSTREMWLIPRTEAGVWP
jgi:hypothetical protein